MLIWWVWNEHIESGVTKIVSGNECHGFWWLHQLEMQTSKGQTDKEETTKEPKLIFVQANMTMVSSKVVHISCC